MLDKSKIVCLGENVNNPKAVTAPVLGGFYFYRQNHFPETPRFREGGGASFGVLTSLRIFYFYGELSGRQKTKGGYYG